MKKTAILIVTFFAGIVLLTTIPKATHAAAAQEFYFGTTASGSSIYSNYVTHCRIVNTRVPEVKLTVVETGSTIENLRRMMRGELKFGYAASDGAYEAFSGTGKFAGNPYRGLRTIWLASDLPFAWIVRKDSGITQLEGLNGKPFNTGIAGGVTPAISEAVLNMFGVKAITHATSTTDAIAQMKDRRVVGWVKAGMHPSAEILELQADMAINILSFTEQQYEKIHERFIFLGYSKLPDGIYKGVKGFNTYSITAGAFVDATISADLVYKIIKAMHEGWPEFVKSFPQFTYLDLITNTLSTPVPLHAGVVKYFRQLRKEVPQGLIPQEYKD